MRLKLKISSLMKRQISIAFCLIALMAFIFPTEVFSQKGQTSVGLRGGFTSRNTTGTAGLYLSYQFTDHFRLAPKVDYAFRHNKIDAFSFNADAECPIALNADKNLYFYPIAGLNYSTYSTHFQVTENDISDDSSERTNNFGLNLGAGLEYRPTATMRLAFESKCTLVKQNTGAWLTLSIGYLF